jgi:Tfp pilus assembly protein PilE
LVGKKMFKKLRSNKGVTLIEIISAAVIAAMLAGGVLVAFLVAVRLSYRASYTSEGSAYAQQSLERFRNRIACRQPAEAANSTWYDANCIANLPASPITDPLPSSTTSSIANLGSNRSVALTPVDINGDGNADYIIVRAKVQWNPQ